MDAPAWNFWAAAEPVATARKRRVVRAVVEPGIVAIVSRSK